MFIKIEKFAYSIENLIFNQAIVDCVFLFQWLSIYTSAPKNSWFRSPQKVQN